MGQIGVRELRNHTSAAIRRAMAGERIVITIDGVPAAQLGPLNSGHAPTTIADLIASGRLQAPRTRLPLAHPPRRVTADRSSADLLREQRER